MITDRGNDMKKLLLAFALLAASPFPVLAGEIAGHAAAAETAAAAGDGPGAIKEFRSAGCAVDGDAAHHPYG